MAKNMSTWGKEKARERYADGGSVGETVYEQISKKKGGPVPGSDAPPTVPSEWPPHPLKKQGGKV